MKFLQVNDRVYKTSLLFNFHWLVASYLYLFHWYSIFSSHDALNIYACCLLILKHRREEKRKILFISFALLKKAFHRKILQDVMVDL